MSKIGEVLTAEISRLARKEIKKAVGSLSAEVKALKRTLAAQGKSIAALEKTPAARAAAAPLASAGPSSEDPPAAEDNARFTPLLIKKLRKRLDVSQAEMAVLADVSQPAVASWEQGRAKPRAAARAALGQARKLSPKQAREIIERKRVEGKA